MSNNEENKLIKKIFIKGNLNLLSPLAIGNGNNDITDNDILKDGDGKIFIPGTSLAGITRNYLKNYYSNSKEKIEALNVLLGDENNKNGKQSSVYFYDAFLKKEGNISTRDGIMLEKYIKVTKENHKFNYQIAEEDNIFLFKLEISIRKINEEYIKYFYEFIRVIITAINNGEILIGSKIKRGLGKIKLSQLKALVIKLDNKKELDNEKELDRLFKFEWDSPEFIEQFDFIKEIDNFSNKKLTKITVPLKVKDTLFVRNYLLSNDDVDAEQLNYNGKFVIPGNTWSGAFKHRANIILNELLEDDLFNHNEKYVDFIIEELFGKKSKYNKSKDEGRASRIIFEESKDKNKSRFIEIRRTKIDRFTGSALNKGLFDARVAVGGETELNIWIKDARKYEIAIILLVIFDLINGYLAIGGETSVGRGIISTNMELKLNEEDIIINDNHLNEIMKKEYMVALMEEVMK